MQKQKNKNKNLHYKTPEYLIFNYMSLPMEWKMINDAKFSLNNFIVKKIIFKVISKKKSFHYSNYVLFTRSCYKGEILFVYYDCILYTFAFVINFHKKKPFSSLHYRQRCVYPYTIMFNHCIFV